MENFAIRNLTFKYPECKTSAIEGVNLVINQGDFIVLCGPSGCGKTTLLRQLKSVLEPFGERSGEIIFEGEPLENVDLRTQSSKIGFVLQSPENQIVTDKVWHELAFGLEGLGFDTQVIRRRVAEMASFFGIQDLFYRSVNELSGGQKQLINLASIMVMHPSVLILDEPASQLDPIAASDFIEVVAKINRELGTTVIMTEHRLEEVFPICSRAVIMDKGRIICDAAPGKAGEYLKHAGHQMFLAMPAPMRVYARVPNNLECPLSVRDGAVWLDEFRKEHKLRPIKEKTKKDFSKEESSIKLDEVWFRYEKDGGDVLKGVSFKAYPGEFLAILGGNGTGKSTLLSVIAGANRAYRGKIFINGSNASGRRDLYNGILGVLPQNPKTLFVKKTVREDLLEIFKGSSLTKDEQRERLVKTVYECRIEDLLDRHPYDLSGGEQQRVALAKVLIMSPRLLLLDEPTKGLDAGFKKELVEILKRLLNSGVTVIMVSHDIEFCAEYADRCGLFFDGSIAAEEDTDEFFKGNSFYTTAANRMAANILPDAVTAEDIMWACGTDAYEDDAESGTAGTSRDSGYAEGGKSGSGKDSGYAEGGMPGSEGEKTLSEWKKKTDYIYEGNASENKADKLPAWRKIIGAFSGVAALAFFINIMRRTDLSELINDMGASFYNYMSFSYVGFLVTLILSMAMFSHKSGNSIGEARVSSDRRKLSKRTLIALFVSIIAIPLTIFLGVWLLNDRKYYFISLLVILEALIPFVSVFEGRKPQARELVITSVLCALAVAGRSAFFMLPAFKPVIALVIISGVALGGETGFLVGAVSMLVSDIMMGQGPWTPWQMFVMGLIGLLAGVLFRKGFLKRDRISLCIFGAFSAVFIYGGIMNPGSIIMWEPHVTKEMIITAYITGFPYDLVQAAATVVFLWIASKPMLEKLDRIKVKYGLMNSHRTDL